MENTADVALLILRIAVGGALALHGLEKLRHIAGTANWFESVGLRPGVMHAWVASGTEMSAGLGIAAGFLTPFAGLALVGVMATAGWVGHRKNGFSSSNNGWELVFVLGTVAAVVTLHGPGDISLDSWFNIPWSDGSWFWFAFAVIGGVVMSVLTLVTFYRPPTTEES